MEEQVKVIVQSSDLSVVDDMSAPTILVDSLAGAITLNGVLVFGCTQTILEVHSATVMVPKRKIVARLAIPVGSLPTIANFFRDQLAQMEADGSITLSQEVVSENGTDI